MKQALETRIHELPVSNYERLADSVVSGRSYQCQIPEGRQIGNDCIDFVAYALLNYSMQHGYPEYSELPAVKIEIGLGFFHSNNRKYWPAICIRYEEPIKGNKDVFVVSQSSVLYPADNKDVKPQELLELLGKRLRYVSGMYIDDFVASSLHHADISQELRDIKERRRANAMKRRRKKEQSL